MTTEQLQAMREMLDAPIFTSGFAKLSRGEVMPLLDENDRLRAENTELTAYKRAVEQYKRCGTCQGVDGCDYAGECVDWQFDIERFKERSDGKKE